MIATLVVVGAVAIAYVFLPAEGNVITTEQGARASCEVALKSHLHDVKKESERWQVSTVRFDSSADRWLCTVAGEQGKKLFIILKPKTGGFEVSASDS